MSKPDWKDAPEWKFAPSWANYMTQDSDGDYFWHEKTPYARLGEWESSGLRQYAGVYDMYIDWKDTLERRP